MSEPFVGQIQQFGFSFAPRGWAFCQGQLMSIAQNTALFSLLGTTFGGDGITTFGIPDMRGRIPLHFGQGPGLSNYDLGQQGGVESVTLITSQMPQHNHGLMASTSNKLNGTPNNNSLGAFEMYTTATPDVALGAATIGMTGNNQPHENRQPFLVINWCIATEGIYPSRN